MISEETFRLYGLALKIGQWTFVLPYVWNPKNYTIETVKNLLLWRIIKSIDIIIQLIIYIVHTIPVFMDPNLGAVYRIYGLSAMFLFIFALIFQIDNFINAKDRANLTSRTNWLVRKLG